MSTPPEDDEQEEYFVEDDDEETPTTVANQTLDMLALHLPPEKFLPHIVSRFSNRGPFFFLTSVPIAWY